MATEPVNAAIIERLEKRFIEKSTVQLQRLKRVVREIFAR